MLRVSRTLAERGGAFFVWVLLSFRALGRPVLTRTWVQRLIILPTVVLTLTSLVVLLFVNVMLARPAIYLTALFLMLFQSGHTFCHIVFSFLPRVRLDGPSGEDDVER